MANFSLPTLTSTYANFVTEVKSRDEDIIKMLDGVTPSNLPSGAKRWNAISNKFEKYNGSTWSVLTTLYEIKVADSNKLNGQLSTYYATADHNHNLVYAALSHTHDYSPSTHNHDSTYLGKTATAADSSKIGGYLPSLSAFGSTAAIRDANGDLVARWFHGYLNGTASYANSAGSAGSCTGNSATASSAGYATNAEYIVLPSSGYKHLGAWGNESITATGNILVNSAYRAERSYSSAYADSAGTISGGVGANVAAIGAGAVGSYSFWRAGNIYKTVGATCAGSSFGLSGTWRCMGGIALGVSDMTYLMLRIA